MIRLTMITLAVLIGVMYIWGTDDGSVAPEEITEAVIAPVEPVVEEAKVSILESAVSAALVEAAVSETEEPVVVELDSAEKPADSGATVEVAQLETVSLANVAPVNTLLVVESSDAPPDAVVSISTETATEPNNDATILVVTGNRVNLRAGPSTSNAVVTSLTRGQEAELLAEADSGWLHIRHLASGSEGYMSGDFLRRR